MEGLNVAAFDFSEFASPLPHPGEILREDYLVPLGLSPGALARAMGLKDRARIERLSRGAQAITADTALRLGRVFDTSAQFWLNLQVQHDLSAAAIDAREDLAGLAKLPQLAGAYAEPSEAPRDPRPDVPYGSRLKKR